MEWDFTIEVYKALLDSLKKQSYSFLPFKEFINSSDKNVLCLRHDVDLLPKNSLEFAKIQHEFGISGTYYFRAVSKSWDEGIITDINALGHEVGYHYENLSIKRGEIQCAIKDFEKNLEKLRQLVPVETICMHGSPRSKYDSKELWKHYDYRDHGIIGEPYFDIDFNEVAYYTDTGRMWDGSRYSVRDKVSNLNNEQNSESEYTLFPTYHTTRQMIDAILTGTFPQQAMLTFHPQRWTTQPLPWMKEYIWQYTKNMIKYFFINHKS